MPKTLLLADDSSTIRKIVELTFNGTDIRVESVGSGEQALDLLTRIEPDLILADVVMPGPNGYEICRHVKESGRAVPVVLLSSTFEPYDTELAAECRADQHLIKPFESAALMRTVHDLLNREPANENAEFSETDNAVDALVETPPKPPALPDESPPVGGGSDDPALDERLVDAVSRAVVRRLSEAVVREIAREVVPDLAERIIRERIRQLESEDS